MTQSAPLPRSPPSLPLLGLASALSPFGMVVIAPALPGMAAALGVGDGEIQWLVAAYLFGLAVGQPVAGILADRIGRRPVLLAGFLLFTGASVACLLLPTIVPLTIARFGQGVGVSVGTVATRAMVRDTHDALGAATALARIGAAQGLAPVLGPIAGGILVRWAGPMSVFLASAVLGLAVTVTLYQGLPETRTAPAAAAPSPPWRHSYGRLLGCRAFLGFTLTYACIQGCFFAFLAVGAAVFATELGMGPDLFGLVWGALGIVYVVAAIGGSRLLPRIGAQSALGAGTLVAALSGAALIGSALWLGGTRAGLLVPLAGLMVAAGIQTPLSTAGAVNVRPEMAGTAAGLSSAIALVGSGAFSLVAGLVYDGSFLPVAALMCLSAMATAVGYWLTRH